jgi:Terminase RNaseH-like domain
MPTRSSSVTFCLGLDLGQAADFSALAVLQTEERDPPRTYAGRHLQRWPLGTSYPQIATDVAQLAARLAQDGPAREVWLAVDATGVGRPVIDMLRRERMPGVKMVPILITGGDTETKDGRVWHVPKRNLVGAVQVALQTGRLKIASALPETATLMQELQNFQMKISLTSGHDSYGAWREGTHDDLVLALACALWVGERRWPRFAPLGTDEAGEIGYGWRPI